VVLNTQIKQQEQQLKQIAEILQPNCRKQKQKNQEETQ